MVPWKQEIIYGFVCVIKCICHLFRRGATLLNAMYKNNHLFFGKTLPVLNCQFHLDCEELPKEEKTKVSMSNVFPILCTILLGWAGNICLSCQLKSSIWQDPDSMPLLLWPLPSRTSFHLRWDWFHPYLSSEKSLKHVFFHQPWGSHDEHARWLCDVKCLLFCILGFCHGLWLRHWLLLWRSHSSIICGVRASEDAKPKSS